MAQSEINSRKTLRLAQHDYAGGVYYVTQATQNRQALFGSLISGRVRLTAAGQMLHDTWHELPRRCPWCDVDEFIVIGHLNPDGLLAFQLSDLPQDTPVTYCTGGAPAIHW